MTTDDTRPHRPQRCECQCSGCLAGERHAALVAVAEIVRRHTHQGPRAMTYHAGENPEEDCGLCRALVAAGVLTLDGIGAGTRAALIEEK